MRVTAKRNAALEGCEHGAEQKARQNGRNYRSTDAASSKAKPRRAKPPPRPSTGVPAGSPAAVIARHVREVCRAAAIDHRAVSPSALRVLLIIGEHVSKAGARAGTAWPSISTLVRLTGLRERAVQYAVAELETAGYLWRRVSRGRAATTNVYQVRMPHAAPDWRRAVKPENAHDGADYSTSDAVLNPHHIALYGCTTVHPIYENYRPVPFQQTQSEEREVRAATAPEAPKADPNQTDIQGDRAISFDSEIAPSDAMEDKTDIARARVKRAPQNERLYPRVPATSAPKNTGVNDYEPSCSPKDTASDLIVEMEG